MKEPQQAIMEWFHTGDGVTTTAVFRTEALRGLVVKQFQLHSNASVTYRTDFIRNLQGAELPTVNGSIIVDNLKKRIDNEIEFNFSNIANNEIIRLIFVVEDS